MDLLNAVVLRQHGDDFGVARAVGQELGFFAAGLLGEAFALGRFGFCARGGFLLLLGAGLGVGALLLGAARGGLLRFELAALAVDFFLLGTQHRGRFVLLALDLGGCGGILAGLLSTRGFLAHVLGVAGCLQLALLLRQFRALLGQPFVFGLAGCGGCGFVRLALALQLGALGGPARGFWQFEQGGGVRGVLTHAASAALARQVCEVRGVAPTSAAVYAQLESDDVLAAAFARLLLWTDPARLPAVGDSQGAWDLYARTWRPGKPHPQTWPALHAQAVAEVTS